MTPPPERRSYHQHCALAKTLDVVGERWTLLIVRDLLLGPLRYSALQRGLPDITTNLLAKRLQEMQRAGLIEHEDRGPGDGRSTAYRLTPLGLGLEPAVHALVAWGWPLLDHQHSDEHHNLEWLLVALRGRYRGGVALRAELDVEGGGCYHLTLTPTAADIGRGRIAAPDLRLRGPTLALTRLFGEGWAGGTLPAGVAIDGAPARLHALVHAFAGPDGGTDHSA